MSNFMYIEIFMYNGRPQLYILENRVETTDANLKI